MKNNTIKEFERAKKALRAILEYEPTEVVYDKFAYTRLVDSYRAAAAARGLGEVYESEEEYEEDEEDEYINDLLDGLPDDDEGDRD